MAISGNASTPALERRECADEAASVDARLRALDAMLGGVAHDLNNALSVVLMNLDVMQQDGAVTAKHERRVDGMLDAMTKASALVRHLLSFSHSRRPEPQVVSVSELLDSLVELLRVAVGKEVEVMIETHGDAGPCCVVVDPPSFEVGIAHAALQLAAVMPGGGRLAFDLAKSEADDCVIVTLTAEPRGPDQHVDGVKMLDLALLEYIARGAHGRLAKPSADARPYRLSMQLPAASDISA